MVFYDACENQLQYVGRTRGPEDVKSTVSQMPFYNAKPEEQSVASSLDLIMCIKKTMESEEQKHLILDLS